MSERMRDRSTGRILVIALGLLVSASTACRDSNKQEPSKDVAVQADASAVVAPPPVPVDSASTASAVVAVEEEATPADAGPDAAKRRLRRIVGAGADAGSHEAQLAASAEPPVAAAPHPPASGKRAVTTMKNDNPFGGSSGTAAPALKKTPLPGDDPWK